MPFLKFGHFLRPSNLGVADAKNSTFSKIACISAAKARLYLVPPKHFIINPVSHERARNVRC